MFKSAKQLKKETDEGYKRKLEKEVENLIEQFESKSAQAKRNGEYSLYLYTNTNTNIELIAIRTIRKKLKEKGYKCGFIYFKEGYSSDYYQMKVSWKKIK